MKEIIYFGEAVEEIVLGHTKEERVKSTRYLLSLTPEEIEEEVIRLEGEKSSLPSNDASFVNFYIRVEFMKKLKGPDRELYRKSLQYLLTRLEPSYKMKFLEDS